MSSTRGLDEVAALDGGRSAAGSGPITRDGETWYLYLVLAVVGYQQSILGSIAPFLRDAMALTKVEIGWHFSIYALGLLMSGTVARWALRFVAPGKVLVGSAVLMVGVILCFALPLAIAGTLSCAFCLGLSGGATQTCAQAAVARRHGASRGIALTEATVLAALGVLAGPLVIGLAVRGHLEWRYTLVVPAVLLATLLIAFRGKERTTLASFASPEERDRRSALPAAAVAALCMIVLGIAAEWGIGFWGAQFLETALGVDSGTGVTLMAAFFGGTLFGRLLASRLLRIFSLRDVLICAMAGGGLAIAILWAVPLVPVAILALALAGMCLGNFFPLILSIANEYAPMQPAEVSSRATQAVALALLVVPVVLGALGSKVGLVNAVGVLAVLPLGMLCLFVMTARTKRSR